MSSDNKSDNERWDLGGPSMCAYDPMEDEYCRGHKQKEIDISNKYPVGSPEWFKAMEELGE